ncbi:MAG: leucyl aminopeptidase [Chthonomonadales bacterium]
MNITVLVDDFEKSSADALLIGRFEGEKLDSDLVAIDGLLGGALSAQCGLGGPQEASGKRGELATFYTNGALKVARVILLGLGKKDEFSPKVLRETVGTAARALRDRGMKKVATSLHRNVVGKKSTNASLSDAAANIVEAVILSMWEPDSYKASADRKGSLDELVLLEPDSGQAHSVTSGTERGQILGESINLTRTLVNEPANALPPAAMAERARLMATDIGLGCDILDEDDMYRHNMGGILSVSVGSENRARLIVLKHMPNPGQPAIALVGKGITFDTGGISIKPTEGMGDMKGDMAGAAAVIGAMRAISLLKLNVNIVGVAPCAENMPDGKAFRPGDVIRFMNGKTSEIMTTDAEGRLVLADALVYSIRNLQAERVVDVATLTGACVVALGHVSTGAWTNKKEWLHEMEAAAETAGENVWPMPLYPEYTRQIRSDIADLKNSGGRPGGANCAAAFLKEFVDDTPWVHLDIAGTATTDKATHLAKGPTGAMVRTFVQVATRLATK